MQPDDFRQIFTDWEGAKTLKQFFQALAMATSIEEIDPSSRCS